MIRKCSGGPHGTWCGETATVVCTRAHPRRLSAQWYACDDETHQEGAYTEPLEKFLERIAHEARRTIRKCNGGPHGTWCGETATVVCTERTRVGYRPLQWYACDDETHQEGAYTEPLEKFLERILGTERK
jgi:hypothetical protein